jgi:hypothetical protein
MKKSLISILVVSIIILTIGMTYWYKNNPTIIDLGNGWKSYSHPQIGFTVKIPSEAEVKYAVLGDKNNIFSVSLSNGAFSSMRAVKELKCN